MPKFGTAIKMITRIRVGTRGVRNSVYMSVKGH